MAYAHLLDFLAQTNIVVTALTTGFILATRSAAAAYTGLGALLCVVSAKIVKILLKHPRPQGIEGVRRKATYGMPSTHSTTISYFATYIVLACLKLPIHPSLPSSPMTRVVPSFLVVPWATLVVMSRVWLGHHTWPQVVVGASYGTVFASVWFFLWENGLKAYGRDIELLVESFL